MNTFYGLVVGIGFGVTFEHPFYGLCLFALGCAGLIRTDVLNSQEQQKRKRRLL